MVEDGSVLRGLDVLGWDPRETRLGHGLDPDNGFFAGNLHIWIRKKKKMKKRVK